MADSKLSSSVEPPCYFDKEPYAVIWDPDRKLTRSREELQPFSAMISLSQTEDNFRQHLYDKRRNTLFVMLLIANNHDRAYLDRLLRNCLLPANNIHSIHLLFPDGLEFEEEYQQMLVGKFGWCRSFFDSKYLGDIRDVGWLTCHERIRFYRNQFIKFENDLKNNNSSCTRSILNLIAKLTRDHAMLLCKFLADIARQIDVDDLIGTLQTTY